MNKFFFYLVPLLTLTFGLARAEDDLSEKQKLSYAIGTQFAINIKEQPFDLDTDAFVQAIRDYLTGSDLKLSVEEIRSVLTDYQEQQIKKYNEISEKNRQEGEKFLAENGKQKDVVVLPSGLQYKIIKSGTGKKPNLDDKILVHYKGTLLNGTEFDSSSKHNDGGPIPISLNNVIKGWQEAVTLMPVGSKWQIYVPHDLAYGEHANGPVITPFSTLIFDIELVSIN